MVSKMLTAMTDFRIDPDFPVARFLVGLRARLRGLVVLLMAAVAPVHAGPMLTLEAGLVQSAGVEFFADPTALSFRIEASSSSRLTTILITVNGKDLTSRLVTLGRLTVSPEGTSGSLVAERLSLLSLGVAGAGTYRVAATVSDTSGPTSIEATLSSGSVAAAVAYTTLAQGTSSAIRGAMRTVIRDQKTWEAQWRAHTANVTPAPAVPSVDFASQMVLAIAMGEQPTGGYSIGVSEVRAGTASTPLTVLVRETRPPKDAIVTQALTSPFHFAAVPLWSGTGRFAVVDDPTAP